MLGQTVVGRDVPGLVHSEITRRGTWVLKGEQKGPRRAEVPRAEDRPETRARPCPSPSPSSQWGHRRRKPAAFWPPAHVLVLR